MATSHRRTDLSPPPATRVLPGLNLTETTRSVGLVDAGSRLDRGRPIPQLHRPVAAAASKVPGIRLPTRPACGPCRNRRRETSSGGGPDPSRRGVQPIRRWQPAAGTVGADGADPGFPRLAAADEVGELSPLHCAENRKSVLIEYARSRSDSVRRSGCRRAASCRTFVGARETPPLMAQQDHVRRDLL